MSMDVSKLKVGDLSTNCYLVKDGSNISVVDPGDEAARIIQEIEKTEKVNVQFILLTHGHYDHILAVDDLTIKYPSATLIIHEEDVWLLKNIDKQGDYLGKIFHNLKSKVVAVSAGSTLPFGDEVVKIIHTPGHTKGSVCYLIGDLLFSGDTIFYHNYGRIDLPWSQPNKMKESIDTILHLPAKLRILPGHGRETTVGEEKNFKSYGNREYF